MNLKDHTDRDFDVVAFMTSEMIERLHRHPNIHDLVKSGVSDTGHMAAILVPPSWGTTTASSTNA